MDRYINSIHMLPICAQALDLSLSKKLIIRG